MSWFEFLLPKDVRVARHWNRGHAALEAGDHAAVLREARALEALHGSGWFQLEACVRMAEGRDEEAVELLERGVAAAPDAILLWQYLGHACKRAHRWQRADEAYAKVTEMAPTEDRHAAAYDHALMWAESGDCARALAVLDADPAPRIGRGAVHHAEIRAGCALRLGDLAGAIAIADMALADRTPGIEDVRAVLHVIRARALHALGGHEPEVQSAIDAALELDKSCVSAASLIREIEEAHSPNAHRWRLTVRGSCWRSRDGAVTLRRPESPSLGGEAGFFATFFAVADTPETALVFCRRFEPPDVRASLRVEESEDMGHAPNEFLGVERARGGYSFFALTPES